MNMLNKIINKIKKFFSYSWEQEYLSDAKDCADLERRQKLINDGLTQHYSIYTKRGYI